MTRAEYEAELEAEVAACYADPLRFVLTMYPWGEPGPLKDFTGPDEWQTQYLIDLGEEVRDRAFDGKSPVLPIRMAVSKGHGVGGSAMAAWVTDWIMSTRSDARGTVTANTNSQLQTKTWAAIKSWTKMCRTAHWFEINDRLMYHKGRKEDWFCAPQSCRPGQSEAFAGQHTITSTSFYINDEDSAVADRIHEVEEGGMRWGEPMQFLFGNPTRSKGSFFEAVFGKDRDLYRTYVIDSRQSKLAMATQSAVIEQWAKSKGEDSDFFRVRVRGLPPSASDLQFISTASVQAAMADDREPHCFPDDALICGLDLARGGLDECVFRFRKGNDARSIPAIRVPGEESRDSMRIVSLAVDILNRTFTIGGKSYKVDTMVVDTTGGSVGGPIYDRIKQMGYEDRVLPCQFSGKSPSPEYANMRAFIWAKLRDALPSLALDNSPDLEQDLTGPGYEHDRRDALVLESKDSMKERGLDSPDDGDALAMTYYPAAPKTIYVPEEEPDEFERIGNAGVESWMS